MRVEREILCEQEVSNARFRGGEDSVAASETDDLRPFRHDHALREMRFPDIPPDVFVGVGFEVGRSTERFPVDGGEAGEGCVFEVLNLTESDIILHG